MINIKVILGRNGLSIHPDVALVRLGEQVTWELLPNIDVPVRWTIYFDHGTPMTWNQMTHLSSPGRSGALSATPRSPGDWKYGIRAIDDSSGDPLADDDPRLIVTT